MSGSDAASDIDAQVALWRSYVSSRRTISTADADELEEHLRSQIDDLCDAGLSESEAFLVAVRRMGAVDELSGEFGREHADRLWKHLVAETPATADGPRRGLRLALLLGAGAGLAVKLPSLLGLQGTELAFFLMHNVALLVLPFLVAFFAIRRRIGIGTAVTIGAGFVVVALVLNLYPFVRSEAGAASDSEWLAALHAIVALWLLGGLAYMSGRFRSSTARMDLIRFTGEWVVYYTLIALGGAVLTGLTLLAFASVTIDAAPVMTEWVIPLGAAGAVVIAAWLVEAKQSVIENIAPVLTKLFTPLFTLMLAALIVATIVQRDLIDADRELLIVMDAVLIVVVGLVTYSLSARDPLSPPAWSDRLALALIVAALIIDAIVLAAMLGRIGEFGFSPNKTASLGLNLILLTNLAGAGWLQWRFLRGTARFATLERWQSAHLTVYFVWCALVVVALPPIFGFR